MENNNEKKNTDNEFDEENLLSVENDGKEDLPFVEGEYAYDRDVLWKDELDKKQQEPKKELKPEDFLRQGYE